jgi:hypothetical protein
MLGERKPLPRDVGDFARLILVCATYQTTFTVLNYIRGPLLPGIDCKQQTAEQLCRSAETILEALRPTDAPSTLTNDSLRSSLECHVSLILMLLYVRLKDVLTIAKSFKTGNEETAARRRLIQWMQDRSGSDARKAIAHAGALLAILRRNSTRGFHEPIVALLAVLVLWTYNQLSTSSEGGQNHLQSIQSCHHGHGLDHALERGSVIRLDKPASSSELAAWYLGRPGLRPHIQGVGNINRPGAGKGILETGRRMLQDANVWALSQGLSLWLGKLISLL